MRKKTWLLIIVLIVFIINITFFVLVRMAKVDKAVQTKITNQLSKTLKAEIKIDEFTFNDKQVNISGIEINSPGKYNLKVNQLYVEYDLIKLIFSKFKNLKAISHIKLYDPVFSLTLVPSTKEEGSSDFIIPDITEFFKLFNIYNGKLHIEYEDDNIKIADNWQNINLAIINTKSSDITLNANSGEGAHINLSGILDNGNLINSNLEIKNYKPATLEISELDSFGFMLDTQVSYAEDNLKYYANIKKIKAELLEKKASIDSVLISGNEDRAIITLHNFYLDENKIEGKASIYNTLSNKRTIEAELATNDIPLQNYIDQVTGNVNAKFNISGKIDKPDIIAKLNSNELVAGDQALKDIEISAQLKDDLIELELINSVWEENQIIGSGYYKFGDKLHLDIKSHNMLWQRGDLRISGNLFSTFSYQDSPEIFVNLDDIKIQSNSVRFADMNLKINLIDEDLAVDLTHPANDIGFSCIGNIKAQELRAKLKIRSLDLSSFLNGTSLPILTGEVAIEANQYSIVANFNIMVYDRDYGKLGGRLKSDVVLDLSNNHSLINLRTYNAKYNYEPFRVELLAKGSLDSLHIKHFHLNKKVNIDGWIKRTPEIKYGLSLHGEELKLKEFTKYFMEYDTSQQINGNLSFGVSIDNLEEGSVDGKLALSDFKLGDMTELQAELNLTGNNSIIKLQDGSIKSNDQEIIKLLGEMTLKPEIKITANGFIDSLQLADLLPEEKLQGLIKGGVEFSSSKKSNELQLGLVINNLQFNRFNAEHVKFDLLQKDSLLIVNEIKCFKEDSFSLNSQGAIGYNVLNSKSFTDTSNVSIQFEGDLLKLLADQTKEITNAGSKAEFDFKVGTRDSKIFIEKGNFSLTKGSLKIKNQPEEVDKIALKFGIIDNTFKIDKFSFRMGEGKCHISNEINNNEEDFILGTLNLGKILIKTNEKGILINMPGYIPENNVAKVVIAGRNSENFEVIGPFEDIMLIGDLNVSNGGAIFPPNTENLLKLFNTVREKKESEDVALPLSFDLMINLGENVKYVTYPVEIKVNPGGYLNIIYKNEKFTIQDALFIAEEGSVDIFGTKMSLDYLQVQLSRFTEGANISGTFYKKTADGSLITLNIYNEVADNDEVGTLKFSLNSDNSSDRITDILAKLRYNRSMEDISADQRKTLLQDEVIQIAGMGLESAVMDPLLSPVENWIRKTLRLDYFHLQTDLVQNLFASYSSEDKSEYEFQEDTNDIAKFSSEIFLNNLSISMGRYLNRNLFIDYETRVERSQDVALESDMGIFHEFSLRYQLPFKFRIVYRYEILPFTKENPHEIMLERSFKF